MIPKESKALVKGEYGKTPAPIKKEILDLILKGEEPITCRPANLIAPELDIIREKIKDYIEQDEDVLSYALFPQVAEKFFKNRIELRININEKIDEIEAAKTNKINEKEIENKNTENEAIMAAISGAISVIEEEEGIEFVVKSFKRIEQTSSIWSVAGRLARN